MSSATSDPELAGIIIPSDKSFVSTSCSFNPKLSPATAFNEMYLIASLRIY
jgi:hypothetical protein